MLARIRAASVLVLAALAGGCTVADPPFRSADLTARPAIVGTWKITGDGPGGEAGTRIVIAETRHPVSNDRLQPRPVLGAAGNDASTAPAYSFDVTLPGGDASQPPETGHLRAYLLTDAADPDEVLLCLQHEEPLAWLDSAMSVRVVRFVRLRQRGDELVLRHGNVNIFLAPGVSLLDPPSVAADAAAPTVEAALKAKGDGSSEAKTLLTADCDRALAVHRRYGSTPGFWSDQEVKLVREKGQEPGGRPSK